MADTTGTSCPPFFESTDPFMEAFLTRLVEQFLCAAILQSYSDILCPWASPQLLIAEDVLNTEHMSRF